MIEIKEDFIKSLKSACLGIMGRRDLLFPFYKLIKSNPNFISDDSILESLVADLPTEPFKEGRAISGWEKLVRAMAEFVIYEIEVGNTPWKLLEEASLCSNTLLSKEEKLQMIHGFLNILSQSGFELELTGNDNQEKGQITITRKFENKERPN
jgi:hypothetical protein